MSENSKHPNEDRNMQNKSRLAPAAGLTLAAFLLYGVYSHVTHDLATQALAKSRQSQTPEVTTVAVQAQTTPLALDLPGEIAPVTMSEIRARASGYILERRVDIGTHVKAGDILAIIKAPELDRRVAHADALLAQARANLELAKVTARRTTKLVDGGAVSKQDYDTDRMTQQAQDAARSAAAAALTEATDKRDYTTVRAPFDGVVSARNVDVGDLVSADDASGRPLFVISSTEKLRIRVHVPQEAADTIRGSMPVQVNTPDHPGEILLGHVTRTGFVLERENRMLLVEIEVDNKKTKMVAGKFCDVHFEVMPSKPITIIPSESLIFDAEGIRTALVDAQDHAHLTHVLIGRDYGDRVEVLSGLPKDCRLILHPPSSLVEGQLVAPRHDAQGKKE